MRRRTLFIVEFLTWFISLNILNFILLIKILGQNKVHKVWTLQLWYNKLNNEAVWRRLAHLRFWYHVLTCVSLRFSLDASSMRSCTLRYFCRSKLCSSVFSWWSVNAVLALRVFFVLLLADALPPALEPEWCCRGWCPDDDVRPPAPLSDWAPRDPPPTPSEHVTHVYKSLFTKVGSSTTNKLQTQHYEKGEKQLD